jgi:hypothetical protein
MAKIAPTVIPDATLVSSAELADILGIDLETVNNWIRRGIINRTPIGGRQLRNRLFAADEVYKTALKNELVQFGILPSQASKAANTLWNAWGKKEAPEGWKVYAMVWPSNNKWIVALCSQNISGEPLYKFDKLRSIEEMELPKQAFAMIPISDVFLSATSYQNYWSDAVELSARDGRAARCIILANPAVVNGVRRWFRKRQMASFLSKNPGTTTGPAGVVHSVNLSEYGIWEGPLNDEDKARLLINMHDYWCTAKVNRDLIVKEIVSKKYFIDQNRRAAISRHVFKMLRKEHADALCERGCLGLGPLNYYTTVENKKISDRHEGMFITYAEGSRYSIATVSGAGSHVLVYCTTTDVNAQLGYDACVEISEPAAFSQVLAKAVAEQFKGRNELVRAEHSKCVYQHSRVIAGRIHGFSEELIHLGELSVDTIDVLSDKKYLIKESTHATDSEYRFAIVMRTDVPEYTVIECPQVARFCRRVR